MQQHTVHPRQQTTVVQMTPTANSVGPRLEPPELAEAGLNVDVAISVEVGTETLLGGLPVPKLCLHRVNISQPLTMEPIGLY